MQNDVPI